MKMKMMISEASGYFFFFSPLTVTLSLISAHDNKIIHAAAFFP